jgi:hypothetical protein
VESIPRNASPFIFKISSKDNRRLSAARKQNTNGRVPSRRLEQRNEEKLKCTYCIALNGEQGRDVLLVVVRLQKQLALCDGSATQTLGENQRPSEIQDGGEFTENDRRRNLARFRNNSRSVCLKSISVHNEAGEM